MYRVEDIYHIFIGRRGEADARTIEIDVTSMLEEFPGSSITLIMHRMGDELPYLCTTHLDGNVLVWPVSATDVSVAGEHKIEVRCSDGDVLLKSKTGYAQVAYAVGDSVSADPPEAVQTWIDAVTEQLARETEYADQAAHSADVALMMANNAGSALATAEILNDESARSAAASQDSAETSEAYAKGTVNGVAVTSGQTGYHDNADYYRQLAAASAAEAEAQKNEAVRQVSQTGQAIAAAMISAEEAAASAAAAAGSAEDAEDSADAASDSEAAAKASEDAAAISEANAAESEDKAFRYWQDAMAAVAVATVSADHAAASATAAADSEENAAASEIAAQGYAESITPSNSDDLAYILGR